ncbi:aspartate aminotransferase family protein [Aquabacter spiritensis]|uniref:4-aminobutyrate aminotransferase-like enzyme n=1 Tax=Aquabacter spiritensis TaxID=933073 RepID=A0A4R3LYQ1_9HYPH|nr:aminotransferase class III-fold pyridoxal phosphate-dependent enzyme [Aquabacter spiritensis]TCT05603.1 4-aminobutyrate aminotransferase-like enzyme [Aquabacter spiritensis]
MAKDILALNAFAPGAGLPGDLERQVARRRASFGAGSVLFYERPLHLVAARGATVTAADGTTYLDLYNNVPCVGHGHPKVVEAVARQLATLNCHSRYLTDAVTAYAERLLATFPPALSNLVMTCTGSESTDLALRIAAQATGGTGFVVTATAYHGNSRAATEVSPASYKTGGPPAFVRTVPAPDPDRFGADIGSGFAQAVQAAIAALAADGIGFAGLLVDTIFSSDGVFADPPGFLAPAVAAARQAGGLVIADEVQPGFGRTGAGLWGFARHGVVPDIVTLGKPMGNGYPMGGVVTRPDLLAAFTAAFGYFNTFGATPAAAAAGGAVLDVLAEEGLIAHAAEVGGHLRARLADLRACRPALGAARGAGLYLGIDCLDRDGAPDAAGASRLINRLRDRGMLIGAAGPLGHVLKVRPPLCLTASEADRFVDALDACLADAA